MALERGLSAPTFLKLDFLTPRTPYFPKLPENVSLTTVSPAVQANNNFFPQFIFFPSINPLLNWKVLFCPYFSQLMGGNVTFWGLGLRALPQGREHAPPAWLTTESIKPALNGRTGRQWEEKPKPHPLSFVSSTKLRTPVPFKAPCRRVVNHCWGAAGASSRQLIPPPPPPPLHAQPSDQHRGLVPAHNWNKQDSWT